MRAAAVEFGGVTLGLWKEQILLVAALLGMTKVNRIR